METNGRMSSSNIALFVDMENMVISANNIGLFFDLYYVIKKLLETGRITIRRGFGDLHMACSKRDDQKNRYVISPKMLQEMRKMMQENLIQFEDIPYASQNKNTADMRLTVEALSTAYTYPHVDYFAIVSSDRDYVPLIMKLKELGKRIIGVGCSPDTVNNLYVKSCDQFIYYSTLVPSPVQTQTDDLSGRGDTDLLEEYLELLCEAIASLNKKGAATVTTAISSLVRQMRPDFDVALVGFDGFRDLVEEAERRGLCKSAPHGGDLLVTPSSSIERPSEGPLRHNPFKNGDLDSVAAQYRVFFENKLHTIWPSAALRASIAQIGSRLIEQRNGEVISLRNMSFEIAREIRSNGGPEAQPPIFKVLYGLFRRKTFDFEVDPEEGYNPWIKRAIVPPDQWNEQFIKNSLTVLKQEKRGWPLNIPALARFFEVEEARMQAMISELENGTGD